jgi:glutamate-1-semialdehyde 2,1-aminomutase
MEQLAPAGPVYQAGTLSGNPLAMSAGLAQLDLLEEEKPWTRLEEIASRLESGFRNIVSEIGLGLTINRVGSMMTVFFTGHEVKNFRDATRAQTKRHAVFCREMLGHGIYLAPSQFEALFVSTAHTVRDIDETLAASRAALEKTFSS